MSNSTNKKEIIDPLLTCLSIMTKTHSCPKTEQMIRAHLPMTGEKLSRKLFLRAAEIAGFEAKHVKRKLTNIAPETLPVILVLSDRQACILKEINQENNIATIINPKNHSEQKITLDNLDRIYCNETYLIKTLVNPDIEINEKTSPAHWFWNTFYQYRSYYSEVLMVSLFTNLFAIALPLFIMNVYDRVIPNFSVETLWVMASGMMIILIFDYLMKCFRVYYVDLANQKIDIVVSSKIFNKLLGTHLDVKKDATGAMAHKVHQFESVTSFLSSSTLLIIFDFPFVLLFLAILAIIGGWLVLIPAMAIPIVILISLIVAKPLQKSTAESYTYHADKQSILVESLKNMDLIKSVVSEGPMLKKWEYATSNAAKSGLQSRYYLSQATNTFAAINLLTLILIVVAGVYSIAHNNIGVGALIACVLLTNRALSPLSQLLSLLLRYQLAKYSLAVISKMMQEEPERPFKKKFLHRDAFIPSICFDNVSLKFHSTQKPIFENVSFTINEGEHIGIIGPMGAGKSTLLKLIMGFYRPTSGSIILSDCEISHIDPAEYRLKIGYVQQENRLLRGTIRENIVMKDPGVSDEQLIDICKLTGAYDFIKKYPKGFDMDIDEDGSDLSGGQKQTISLSRALLYNPKILLFDEPFQGIDTATEQIFMKNINEYGKGKTLLMVTHRTSLLPLVDRLIVINKGKIIADGPREQILKALSVSINGK